MSEGETEPSAEERAMLEEALLRGLPFMVYPDHEGRQRIFELPDQGKPVTVGRTTWADIPLTWDEGVSRLHAQIEWVAGEWTIVDEGLSRNGTFVNGTKVTGRVRLRNGDEVLFGETIARFHSPGELEASQTVAMDTPTPEG
jgi:pSer/pThr/pTyr-binding forkhead associated (FHA) protein